MCSGRGGGRREMGEKDVGRGNSCGQGSKQQHSQEVREVGATVGGSSVVP